MKLNCTIKIPAFLWDYDLKVPEIDFFGVFAKHQISPFTGRKCF